MQLLSQRNPKIEKSDKAGSGFLTKIMMLAPWNISGFQVCASASPECAKFCLNTSGHGVMKPVQEARTRKTRYFFEDRIGFMEQLRKEIRAFVRKCKRENKKPAMRLNGLSDLLWESLEPSLFTDFPEIQFYDYTKHFNRMSKAQPSNYHLTFSRSETNHNQALEILASGQNVAVVFDGKDYPANWLGFETYNADLTDLRFLDPSGENRGMVGALYAKGKARQLKSAVDSFVWPINFDKVRKTVLRERG